MGARPWIRAGGWGAVALLAAGCAASVSSRPEPTPLRPGAEWTGYASWYGHPHHGRRTASGEVFDRTALTAAHRTLPFGTRLLVTNLANGRSVEVRVNDRGPSVPGRLIDLSEAAAERLGARGDGVFAVRIRVVGVPEPAAGPVPVR
ncbi:MAG TPA: septal ring lytic transglycosylase RlpA family protein [Calidithermus sp.]|nr:septal ring lytic transglycosylase RlpA family protein [Calidithermus sp.]